MEKDSGEFSGITSVGMFPFKHLYERETTFECMYEDFGRRSIFHFWLIKNEEDKNIKCYIYKNVRCDST